MKYLKYLGLLGQILGFIEAAKAGSFREQIRGLKVGRETWDLEIVGKKRAGSIFVLKGE